MDIPNEIRDFMIQAPVPSEVEKYELYSYSGIPLWCYNQTMDRLKIGRDSLSQMDIYLKDLNTHVMEGTHIIIYSEQQGSGKSTLQFSIAKKAVDLGFQGMCFYYSDLLSLFKECLAKSTLKMAFKRVVQQSDFIVVDSFGSGYVVKGEYAVSEFTDLLYYMDTGEYHRVPLIMSTSKPIDVLGSYMDDSAFSKLQSSSYYIAVEGKDIRLS